MNTVRKGEYACLLYRGEESVRLEEEIRLPDYCPGIVRLIRVEAVPVFEKCTTRLRDTALTVDVSGNVEFTVLYYDAQENICTHGFSADFSENFKKELGRDCGANPSSLFGFVTPAALRSYPKVMALDRLLSRFEMTLSFDVYCNREYSAYDAGEAVASHKADADMCESNIAQIISSKSENFTLTQEIKIPSSLPPCEKVLSVSAIVLPESNHPSDDSVSVFSNVLFSVLYLAENTGEAESFYQPVEVRDVIECDDCAQDSVCRIRALAGGGECTVLPDSFGEMRVFSLTLPYTLNCLVFENTENTFVSDIYCIGGGCEKEYEAKDFSECVGTLSESLPFRRNFQLKGDVKSVKSVSVNTFVKSCEVNSSSAFADVTLFVSALVEDSQRGLVESEQTQNIKVEMNVPESIISKFSSENLFCDAEVYCAFADGNICDGELEVTGEFVTRAIVFKKNCVKYVSDVEFSQGDCKKSRTVFYYPSKEDTLWTVGQRYGVEREKIRQANKMETDTLPAVCLIPFEK